MKSRIITKNKDIYNTLKSLQFKSEVSITSDKLFNFKKIINTINKKKTQITVETSGNIRILKKINPSSKLDFDIYLR